MLDYYYPDTAILDRPVGGVLICHRYILGWVAEVGSGAEVMHAYVCPATTSKQSMPLIQLFLRKPTSIIHLHDRRKPMKIYINKRSSPKGPDSNKQKESMYQHEAITQGDEKRRRQVKRQFMRRQIQEKYKTFIPQSQQKKVNLRALLLLLCLGLRVDIRLLTLIGSLRCLSALR